MALDEARPEADREAAIRGLAELDEIFKANPLQRFEPHTCAACHRHANADCREHRVPQLDFFRAQTRIVAAFAGTRFGKTTALTVRALIECVDEECLPQSLRQFKRWDKTTAPRGTFGRIVNPSFKLLDSVILDSFRLWTPKSQLLGGSFDKAYKGAPDYKLSFANGSFVEFFTYDQDVDKFGGAARHFVGYDEPPPRKIRRECQFRTVDFGGYEMFTCTPLEVNVGWLRRDIFRQRESPDITVIRGSIHDNPTLDHATKMAALGDENDPERKAREFGDFVQMGGLVYADFDRAVTQPPVPDLVRGLDLVVGIDPGIRNAALVFSGFDADGVLVVFGEALLQDKTPVDYAKQIRSTLAKWGCSVEKTTFVVDPAYRQRNQTNAETVETALAREGIYCCHGQHDVEAGVQQLRTRMQHKRIAVSNECRLLRDEADDYEMENRDDGVFKPIKTDRMHLLDALRYVAMHRPYDPSTEDQAPHRMLGWDPNTNHAPASEWLTPNREAAPMGAMS